MSKDLLLFLIIKQLRAALMGSYIEVSVAWCFDFATILFL